MCMVSLCYFTNKGGGLYDTDSNDLKKKGIKNFRRETHPNIAEVYSSQKVVNNNNL